MGNDQFSALEEEKLIKANFMAKPKEKLNSTIPLLFNRYILSLNKDFIALHQKNQDKKINVINVNFSKQGYIEQHAYRAYIAFICQPKTSFNLFVAT